MRIRVDGLAELFQGQIKAPGETLILSALQGPFFQRI